MYKVWGLSIPKSLWVLISVELFLVFICVSISANISYESLSYDYVANNGLLLLLAAFILLRCR